jgi:hypothetical protein
MKLKETIEAAWDNRELLGDTDVQHAIYEVVNQLDRGLLRVAQGLESQRLGQEGGDSLFPHQENGDHRGTSL